MQSSDKSNTDPMQQTFDMVAETPAGASPKSSRLSRKEYNRQWAAKKYASDPEYRERARAAARARNKARYWSDPEYRKKYRKRKTELTEAQRAKKRAWTKRWCENNKEHRESYRLNYEYGITLERYREILEAQGGVCLLCLKPPTERKLAVDHDHETGQVRGLMHRTCNSSFRGIFGDDPRALIRAYHRFGYMADVIRHPGTWISGGLAGIA